MFSTKSYLEIKVEILRQAYQGFHQSLLHLLWCLELELELELELVVWGLLLVVELRIVAA
jgi:hypothetical protein